MKKIKLFVNNNSKSQNAASKVIQTLKKYNFEIVENDFDLGIAVGGDGSFLRMIKDSHFKEDALYVGVNAGTLGFAQEVNVEEIEEFISSLEKDNYFIEKLGIEEIEVETSERTIKMNALNEVVIRDNRLNISTLEVSIDNYLLEEFIGDGLLISTSFGSTAYNLSLGGSIVYNTLHTLQITPISPLNNTSSHNLLNSVILPSFSKIEVIPKKNEKNLIITVDGENHIYNNIQKITITLKENAISVIRKKDYSFIKKINDKFIK